MRELKHSLGGTFLLISFRQKSFHSYSICKVFHKVEIVYTLIMTALDSMQEKK